MSGLRLAIPSKGRLKEQVEAYLADAGLRLTQAGSARGYAARLEGLPDIDVQLLSASEIASGVVSGDIHLGVTGEDLLRETVAGLDTVVHLLMPLGFGRARLVVAAPKSWIDVDTMSDVEDVGARHEARTGQPLRVATKYVRQTRAFFDARGVEHYRIVESAGATEGAPAAGAAELIVDITTTGSTLEANGLKIIRDGLILDSQAQLAASLKAEWTDDALASLRALMDAIEARHAGRTSMLLTFDAKFDAGRLANAADSGLTVIAPGEALCPRVRAHEMARRIAQSSGKPVRTAPADFIYRPDNARFDAFRARVAG